MKAVKLFRLVLFVFRFSGEIGNLENQTKSKKQSGSIQRLYMAAVLGSAFSGEVGLRLLLCPFGSNIVIRTACCTVGIGFPVYSTFKAIEKKDRMEQERWLLYWAAYGSFSLVEMFSDKILYWFPLYYHMKFAFLVWLQLPSGNGSKHLYSRHLRPFMLRHQARLDYLLDLTSKEVEKFLSNHHEEIQFIKALLVKSALTVSQMMKGISPSPHSHGQNAIEGPSGPEEQQIEDSNFIQED